CSLCERLRRALKLLCTVLLESVDVHDQVDSIGRLGLEGARRNPGLKGVKAMRCTTFAEQTCRSIFALKVERNGLTVDFSADLHIEVQRGSKPFKQGLTFLRDLLRSRTLWLLDFWTFFARWTLLARLLGLGLFSFWGVLSLGGAGL